MLCPLSQVIKTICLKSFLEQEGTYTNKQRVIEDQGDRGGGAVSARGRVGESRAGAAGFWKVVVKTCRTYK